MAIFDTDEFARMVEIERRNKALFVQAVSDALVRFGEGRYDYLADAPLEYECDGKLEWVVQGVRRANVTGDSLTAMLGDVDSQIF